MNSKLIRGVQYAAWAYFFLYLDINLNRFSLLPNAVGWYLLSRAVTALEEEAVKALTGESQLDLSIVNQMLLKHRAKLEAAQTAMEEAQTRMQAEQENAKATKAQVDELLSWAQCFDKADIGTKHLIVSRLIERVDVRTGYKVHIKFKISLKQFLGQE